MAGHCIFLTVVTLYVIQHINLILAAPSSNHRTIAVNYENENKKNEIEIKNIESTEIQLLMDSYENNYHNQHKVHKRRTKRNLPTNACGGRLASQAQTLSVAQHRQAAMVHYRNILNESKNDLIESKQINADDFEAMLEQSKRYEFLKIVQENDELKISDWHYNMQIYTHTFEYLHRHQRHLHTKCSSDAHTYEYILQELKIATQKIVCELQSMALHLEEKPELKLLTFEEKKTIEKRFITNKQSTCVNETDVKYAKKYHFDNINGMRSSLYRCMNDCSCVKDNKSTGECLKLSH